MRILVLLFLLYTFAFSKVYYSRMDPYEIRNISSNVSGLVLYTNENMFGQKLSNKAFIRIDSELDEDELKAVSNKLQYLKNTLETNQEILVNLKEALKRKKENYQRIKALSIKSRVEKDREFYDVVSSENNFLATLKEINSLKSNIADLTLRKQQLLFNIKNKKIRAKGFVLYDLKVQPGNMVNIGTPLATVADVSKAILSIYLDKNDLLNIKKKVIFIDGKKTNYKISRLSKIADSKNISKYMAQIIIKSPKVFSKLVKIELRDNTNEK
ncbi:HlyD family efflux transporter periplasmic adaptor subunit [Sulfurimonas sp.]